MKSLLLLTLVCLAFGCSRHSEFDVTPAQVTQKLASRKAGPGGMPDLDHLPANAVKHEFHFKKGDRLPDGTIADHDRKMVTIEIPKSSVGGKQLNRVERIETQDTETPGN